MALVTAVVQVQSLAPESSACWERGQKKPKFWWFYLLNRFLGVSALVQWVGDQVLSQGWHRFDPWPRCGIGYSQGLDLIIAWELPYATGMAEKSGGEGAMRIHPFLCCLSVHRCLGFFGCCGAVFIFGLVWLLWGFLFVFVFVLPPHSKVTRPGIEPELQEWQCQIPNWLSHQGTPQCTCVIFSVHVYFIITSLCKYLNLVVVSVKGYFGCFPFRNNLTHLLHCHIIRW